MGYAALENGVGLEPRPRQPNQPLDPVVRLSRATARRRRAVRVALPARITRGGLGLRRCGGCVSIGEMVASTFGYARAEDGAFIGYRVDGDGPIDLVVQPDWPGNIDLDWQDPVYAPWLRELSSIGRVITHDHRGVGLSSRNVEVPTLETRAADLLAVLRATGTRRPVLCGSSRPER
jgi:hypothetical protein